MISAHHTSKLSIPKICGDWMVSSIRTTESQIISQHKEEETKFILYIIDMRHITHNNQ